MKPFAEQLQIYKKLIDADIEIYGRHVHVTTSDHFGRYPTVVTDAFLDMLSRGGKRLRGALVMVGYEMCGGQDQSMIVRAATAIEMLHAHLLIIDDIQDHSDLRRGRPTVHELLKTYHKQHKLPGEAEHTGLSLALNAAWTGGHAAYRMIGSLNVDGTLRANAMAIMADAIVTTAHGQTQDFMQELTPDTTLEDIEHTMEWKTAYYTILNPLCVGMVLAGAGCEDTDAIRDYALHTGKVFQITDDLIGMFGTSEQTGKNNMDDMREGKRTLLTVYALSHTSPKDHDFLNKCLGNSRLSRTDFEHCRQILENSGARKYAEEQSSIHISAALRSLAKAPSHWQASQRHFLEAFAQSMLQRQV
jgi:geranylgeranyl pyrophosphate synthase